MSLNTFSMPNDLSDLCRVCLQLPEESHYLDLTTIYDEEDNLTYGECFTICTQINLSDGEGVPHHLCKSCGLELQMTYDFYKKVEESKRVIEQCQKRIEKKSLNDSGQQNVTSCDIKQQQVTSLAIADNYVTSVCINATIPSQKDSGLRQQNIMSISDVQESNEFDIVKENDQNKFREQQEEAELSDKIQMESSQESNAGVDIEEHFTMDDYQNVETLEEEAKSNKSMNKLIIKKEYNNEDPPSTSTQNRCQPGRYKIENNISNGNIKPLCEIKIENELIGDYMVSIPTIMPGIYPPIPTHIETSSNKKSSKRVSTKEGLPFECEICGYSLPTKNAFYQHRQRKHNQKKSLKKNSLSFNCRLCSKTFAVMSSLKQHLYTEHKNMGVACEHCGYNLPTKNALYQHRLRKHRNVERKHKHFAIKLKCMQSVESLKTSDSLSTHLENQNTSKKRRFIRENESRIECNDCGYKLPTKNALYQHRLRKHRKK